MTALEICAETLEDVRAARDGGADRVELCSALAIGGLVPARSMIEDAVREGLPVHVLVRLEPGGFVVDAEATARIAREIVAIGAIGAAGVVVGALTADGDLDMTAIARWRDVAGAMDVTLHRAIDLAASPVAAVDEAIGLGLDRILTSGGAASAVAGSATIADMVAAAAGRIEIMAGAGVTPDNAGGLLRDTGANALHASASMVADWSDPQIAQLGFGGPQRRFTGVERVRQLRRTIDDCRPSRYQ